MQIVLVTHFYPAHGGGVESVAAQLAQRMVKAGHQLVWCASDVDPAPSLPGVQSEPMRSSNLVERLTGFPYPLWSPGALARLAHLVRASDGVHVHDCIYAGSLVAAWLARRHRKRLVVTQHIGQRPMPQPLRLLLALAYRLGASWVLRPAEGVAFISPVVQRYFEGLAGPAPHRRYVANGVDTAIFHPDKALPADRRAALGFDPARPLLLFVGRFVGVKRLPLVREMAAARPDWQWCVIGQGAEQPQAWGLPNVRVLAPMAQPALADYFRAADLLVLPSASEGFPLVVQEAMACGLPACITANVAAGSAMPTDSWLELPERPPDTAQLGVTAIAAWLAKPAAQRLAQRQTCSRHAADTWQWEAAACIHLAWLNGGSV